MRFYTQERCWRRKLRPYSCTYRCSVMAKLKFVCACATTALYMRGSRQSSTETDGQAVKIDFRSRSKGQGQFLTVKNLDRGRERTYDKCLSDHPLAAFLHCLLLSHRRGVVYTAHTTHSRALRFVHDSIALLRTAHAVAERTSFVPYMSKTP